MRNNAPLRAFTSSTNAGVLIGKRYFCFILALAVVALSSCDLVDQEEPVPTWIRIDSFRLVDNPNVQEGSLSQNISDAWVFIDDELIGVFELPAEVPILEQGQHRLLVGAGIKISTVSTSRENYLFYSAHTEQVDLTPGETLPIEPVISYRDEAENYNYIVVEEFEDGFLDVTPNTSLDAQIRRTTEPQYVRYGTGAGLVHITDTTNFAWIRTSQEYDLPQLGKMVYLEMDYYNQYDLIVGVHLNRAGLQDRDETYLVLRASDKEEVTWRKAYVDLTSVISSATALESVHIFFIADIQSSQREEGILLLDNIKLMHQQ